MTGTVSECRLLLSLTPRMAEHGRQTREARSPCDRHAMIVAWHVPESARPSMRPSSSRRVRHIHITTTPRCWMKRLPHYSRAAGLHRSMPATALMTSIPSMNLTSGEISPRSELPLRQRDVDTPAR